MTEQVENMSDSVEMTLETDTNNHEEEFDFNSLEVAALLTGLKNKSEGHVDLNYSNNYRAVPIVPSNPQLRLQNVALPADESQGFARAFEATINSGSKKQLQQLFDNNCTPDCEVTVTYPHAVNPMQSQYIEINGVESVVDFVSHEFQAVPDSVITIRESKLFYPTGSGGTPTTRISKKDRTAIILCSYVFSGSRVSYINIDSNSNIKIPNSSGLLSCGRNSHGHSSNSITSPLSFNNRVTLTNFYRNMSVGYLASHSSCSSLDSTAAGGLSNCNSSDSDSGDNKRQRTTTLTVPVPVEELENYTPVVWSSREECYEVYDHYDRQGLKKALQTMTPRELLIATEDEQYATQRISGEEGAGSRVELTEPTKMNIIGTIKFSINSDKKIFRLECSNSSVF